jgi:hypothetical protein
MGIVDDTRSTFRIRHKGEPRCHTVAELVDMLQAEITANAINWDERFPSFC